MFGNKAAKKPKTYIGMILPTSGPMFEEVVTENDKGCVEYKGHSWYITPGSVSTNQKTGEKRVILPEGMAESLTAAGLKTPWLNAKMFFRFMKMNILEQLFKLQSQTPWYKKTETWITIAVLGAMALIMLWGVIAVTSEIGGIGEGLKDIEIKVTNTGSSNPQAGNETTGAGPNHNPIAPREDPSPDPSGGNP